MIKLLCVNFYDKTASAAPKRINEPMVNDKIVNRSASTNMTMICQLQSDNVQGKKVMAYISNELVGVAEPIDSLYFLTISSDAAGELRFKTEDGTSLTTEMPINYVADSHHGTLKAPVILQPAERSLPYKIIENNHVIIIRNNEKYDVTGKKL